MIKSGIYISSYFINRIAGLLFKHLSRRNINPVKVLLLILFLVFTDKVYSGDYSFHTYTTEQGLAQPYIYSLLQDSRGYLWIGTGNGLSRFDGIKFESFTTNDSLADNFINCSISDGNYLWFGFPNGRISLFNGKKFKTVKIPQPTGSPITHFIKGPGKHIWASTYSDGLLEFGNTNEEVIHHGLSENINIITFDFFSEDELIVGTNAGLFKCKIGNAGKIENITIFKEIPDSKITAIKKIKNGNGFYISTENDGIYILKLNQNKIIVSKFNTGAEITLNGIQDILEDSHQNLWICSFGSGLIKLTLSDSFQILKVDFYNKSNGYLSDNTKTVFEDREGNIWCGNYGEGLTLITTNVFSVISFDKILYGDKVFSIYVTGSNYFIGTNKGLIQLNQLTGKIIRFFSKDVGLPNDTVTAIYSTDGKELWIGTDKNGVFRLKINSGIFSKYSLGNGNLENSVTCITGKGNQIFAGTKKGLCNINSETNSIRWYSINQGGLPHNYINSLYLDHSGKLWISSPTNILAYIKEEKVTKIPLNFRSGIITLGPITEDKDYNIWIGSNGNGVLRVKSDSVINLTTKEGLLSDYCYSIICDDKNNVWVGHSGGLSRIKTIDYSVKPINNFNGNIDNFSFYPNAVVKDTNHKLIFGSDHGLISYDPSREPIGYLSPVLGIISIKINDEERNITDKIVLSPGKYKIRIDFLGINLKEPGLVTYQYILEGYDQWSGITKNTNVTYQLTEGNYRFVLKASSGDGAVTEKPLLINIIIQTPIWKKWWVYCIIAILLIVIIAYYIKNRELNLFEENRLLERKVKERTFEILCQKKEIELQRDLIESNNLNIISSITYARHIQNAVLPSQLIINKLLPENFILSKPKDIVSGDFYWVTEKRNKVVFTVADCTGHGVPGAFMSLMGITLLREIVNIGGITRSDDIVMILREKLILALQQSQTRIDTPDGMDLSLCVLDKDNKKIYFTGAKNDLVYFRDGILNVVKANNISVSAMTQDSGIFTMNEIEYKDDDIFYLFSDGYKDQFGGEFNKKFLRNQFYNLLTSIHTLEMEKQKEILEKTLIDWMKDNLQTDDITVMGIRFNCFKQR